MKRILAKQRAEWFMPLASAALLEIEYERAIFQKAVTLFPDYLAVEFKMLVSSESGAAKADYALIDRAYRSWWVVEVELIHHSLDSHVLPQVDVLANAAYGDDCATFLAERSSSLNGDRLKRLMKGLQPKVLLIVNGPREKWTYELSRYGALVLSIEVFRSDKNRELLVIDGDLPPSREDFLSRCRLNQNFLNFLEVDSPAALPSDDPVRISYEGFITDWSVIESADKVWLRPLRQPPFGSGVREFELVKDGAGELTLIDITVHKASERSVNA
jgi:hypothetical protein